MIDEKEKDFLLVDRNKLRSRLKEKGFTREEFFQKIADGKEEMSGIKKGYSRPTIDRLMSGEKSFLVHEFLLAAKILDIPSTDLINEKYFYYLFETGIDTYATLKTFETEKDYHSYLAEMESEDRFVICQDFPSSVYRISPEHERYRTILTDTNMDNQEFYPLRSLLSFVFSPFTVIQNKEKLDILDRFLAPLEKYKHIRLISLFDFNSDKSKFIRRFPFGNMSIVRRKKIMIISTALPNTVLVLRNSEIIQSIRHYYLDKYNEELYAIDKTGSLALLEIIFNFIKSEKVSTNHIGEFLQECKKKLPKEHTEMILRQFRSEYQC